MIQNWPYRVVFLYKIFKTIFYLTKNNVQMSNFKTLKRHLKAFGKIFAFQLMIAIWLVPLAFSAESANVSTEFNFELNTDYLTSSKLAQVKGKVTDNAGVPLIGVSIQVKDTENGTISDIDGNFILDCDLGSVLIISYIGFATQEVVVTGTELQIKMELDSKVLDEVVVVGYGTQKKSSLTGAVSKYKNERLDEVAVSRLDQALQGKIAGVQIQNISSEAGADPTIRVRGLSSINAGASPLVVVDGHPVADGLSFVNSADVESIEVLKDAASASIYGSRGASGVIFVTTKSGKAAKPKYSLKMSTGTKTAYKTYDIMSASDWLRLLLAEGELKKQDPSVPASQLTTTGIAPNEDRAGYIIENELRGGQTTDWQDEALRDAAVRNIQLSVSGGTNDLKYYISGAYQKDQGMMIHSEYDRFNIRSKIDANLSKRIKVSFNVNPSYIKREAPGQRFQDFARFRSWIPVRLDDKTAEFVRKNPSFATLQAGDWAQARYFAGQPYSGLMPDGTNWTSGTTTVNPFNTSNQTPLFAMEQFSITSDEYRALTSGDLTINILPGLDFKTLASSYVNYAKGVNFSKRDATRAGDVNRGVYDDRLNIDLLSENTLTFIKDIKKHSFNLLAGFTAQQTSISTQRITGLDYPSDNITTLNTALSIDVANTFNNKNKIGLLSYLGRLTYNYDDKYLFATSFRADGSSYFAPGNKWGYFPSVSLGWVASKEKFLNQVDWLSSLKFRTSYGVSGNNRIVDFAFIDLLGNANYPFGAGNGTSTIGQTPSSTILSNPNITWERTFQYNGGMNLSIFNDAISFALDVYQSKTDQLLLRQSAQAFTGVPLVWNNIGSVQNRGIELDINTNNIKRKDFSWTTSANISHNRNKVLELGNESRILNQGERTELYINRVGEPLVQYYGYVTDGVWLSQAEITAAQEKGLTSNLAQYFVAGGLKFKDVNGDNKIDTDDRTVIGNPYPDFSWGISNNFKYKNFDFSFMFQGVQGGSIINGDANYLEVKRIVRQFSTDRWVSALNPGDGKTPPANVGFSNWLLTDYTVEDASYWALRDLLLGYTLPKNWTKNAKLGSIRIYFTAQNLYYNFADGFRALNPEARTTSGQYDSPLIDGYQRGAFPVNRSFLFGADINF